MSDRSAGSDSDRYHKAQGRDFVGLESVRAAEISEAFTFVQLADTQFGFMNHDESWLEDIALSERAVHHINRIRPAFAVVCGDLTNSLVDLTPHADPDIRTRQVADFKRVFAQISPDIPLVCVCGNHDVGNRPTDHSIARYVADFGDDYFAFALKGAFCIAANSNLFNLDPDDSPLAVRQLDWLQSQLARAVQMSARHIILFCHHPLFFRDVDEPDESDEFGVTTFVEHGVTHTLNNSYFHIPHKHRRRVVDLLSRFGCKLVFTGHWHRNSVALCPISGVTVVTTTAVGKQLANDQPGMRIVSVNNDGIQYPFFTLDELDREEQQNRAKSGNDK